MANEITFNIRAALVNGESKDLIELIDTFTQSAQGRDAGELSVGTSEEDLTITDIATPGVLYLRNLDATNYVQWGPKSGTMVGVGRLLPQGLPAFISLDNSVTITLVANTAACRVEWKVWAR